MVRDFFIKNMVCNRCITVLQKELDKKGFDLLEIELGRIKLKMENPKDISSLILLLEKNGFSLINSPKEQLVEQVKLELLKLLDDLPLNLEKNISSYLEEKLNTEYSKVSKLFSLTEGITIEKYFIKLKIEKVKELIQNRALNFTQISQLLDYSHLNHLSRQFAKETGMSLTVYKSKHINDRNTLDGII